MILQLASPPDPIRHSSPSTPTWFAVHVVYPMLPVILEGGIKWLVDSKLSSATFSCATLAMSLGLLSMFMNQNLLTHKGLLPDPVEEDAARGTATLFLIFAVISFSVFVVLVLLRSLGEAGDAYPRLAKIVHAFQWVVFLGWIIPIVAAVKAQRSFKLRAIL